MGFSKIKTAQPKVLEAEIIDVEIDISRGLHSFNIVGLGDKSVTESKDRVSSAIKHSGFESPKNKNHRVVVSLAPANIKKSGPFFDLAIALGYLIATKQTNLKKFDFQKKIFVGELSLDGNLKPVKGILSVVNFAKQTGFEEVYLPEQNLKEAHLITGIKIFGLKSLKELILHLENKKMLSALKNNSLLQIKNEEVSIDFSEICGHHFAKRALLIAACGGHNVGLFGSPGSGKTMLSKAFSEIVPDLNEKEIIETTSIHSQKEPLKNIVVRPPFRSPHHTSSYASIIGGGTELNFGEITLAHNGVLFLDEFTEFDRRVIESLRQPIEEKYISLCRAKQSSKFPANFILIVALNPCPCGYFGHRNKNCICTPMNIRNYQKKISGPIVDRIDIWLKIDSIENKKFLNNKKNKRVSVDLREKIKGVKKQLELKIILPKETSDRFLKQIEKLDLSTRSLKKIIRIAKTIAALDKEREIKIPHLLEALQYQNDFRRDF